MKSWALSLNVGLPAHIWAMSLLQAPVQRSTGHGQRAVGPLPPLHRKLPRLCHSALPLPRLHLFLSLSLLVAFQVAGSI